MTVSIGLILPFDSALDREYWQYVPDEVELYVGRTAHIAGPLGVPLIMSVSEYDRVLPVVGDMVTALAPTWSCTDAPRGAFSGD